MRSVSTPDINGISADELHRYSRQLGLPELGAEGQAKLKAASVLIVGAGGLGCPAAIYLAAAGVGRIGLIDGDRVEVSNLHRQILYGDAEVGEPKVQAAARRLAALNPHVKIDAYETRLVAANAREIIAPYDLVIDGADNFPARYLVNDACLMAGKPLVDGSVFRFEGQATVLGARGGPCYRCLYPVPPPAGSVPSCAEGGVLGVLPGLVGMIQATEAIKLIAGLGESLVGRLLLVDALRMRFQEFRIARDPQCALCGEHPTITGLADLEDACAAAADVETIEAARLLDLLGDGTAPLLIDVREPHEYAAGHLAGARNIPLGQLEARSGELDAERPMVLYCHLGIRGAQAARLLHARGFRRVANLAGGTRSWTGALTQSES
jgi:adenylyltransferase/sulfurtransferase